jgi:hypothetical protein
MLPIYLTIISVALIIFFSKKEVEIPEEKYPIKYPLEPMFENFIDVKEEIMRCEDLNDLKRCYVRIIIFQSCYPDGGNFLSELFEQYEIQQEILHIYY